MFQRGDSLHIQLNMQDEKGVNQSVIHWTELVKATSSKFKFSQFIDSFVHSVLQLLNSQAEPRIIEEAKKKFHLSEQTKAGDWYL